MPVTTARRSRTATPPELPDEPLPDLAAAWRTHLEAEGKAPNTLRTYCRGVAAFIEWHEAEAAPGMPVMVSSLDRRSASAFLADVLAGGAATTTARARYSALRRFTAWLVEDGDLEADPLAGMRPPKLDQARVDGLTAAELAAMIRACRVPAGADRWTAFEALRDEAVIRLLADTGARAGELVALTTGDVDLRRRVARVTRAKGGKHRVSAFSAATAQAIDRYQRKARRLHRLAHTPPLWLGTSGRTWAYHALRGALARRAADAGIKGFHPHRLRHTAASAWLAEGGSEQGALAQFGWSSRAMLDRYTEHDKAERAVAEALAMFDARQGRSR